MSVVPMVGGAAASVVGEEAVLSLKARAITNSVYNLTAATLVHNGQGTAYDTYGTGHDTGYLIQLGGSIAEQTANTAHDLQEQIKNLSGDRVADVSTMAQIQMLSGHLNAMRSLQAGLVSSQSEVIRNFAQKV